MPSTICSSCGIVFQDGKKYCRACGEPLRLRYSLLPSIVSSCDTCAIQYVGYGRECALCGQSLVPRAEKIVEVGPGPVAAKQSPANPSRLPQDAVHPFAESLRAFPETSHHLRESRRRSRPAEVRHSPLQSASEDEPPDRRRPRLAWILTFLLAGGLGIAGVLGGIPLVKHFGAWPEAPPRTPQLAFVESSPVEDGRQTAIPPRSIGAKKAEAHNARGLDLTRAGDVEGAIAEFRRAVAVDPKNFQAHNNLGVLYQRKGLVSHAKKEYEAANKAAPGYPVPYKNMAILNEDKSQLGEALRNYSRYLELASNAPDRETILLKIRDLRSKIDSKSRR